MNKFQRGLYSNYLRATATELSQVYGSHSAAKDAAMGYCRRLQSEMDGRDGRICSANSFSFTYAFRYTDVDGRECLCYISKAYDRKFPLD